MTDRNYPIATVDAVLFTMQKGRLKTILMKRDKEPFKEELALPGGFFHTNEDDDAQDSINRVLKEKLNINEIFVEQLFTVSGKERDPRGWSLSVVFLGLFSEDDLPKLPDNIVLKDIDDIPQLAFDHNAILKGAIDRLRGKGAYSTLPAKLLTAPFTLGDLQRIYETVLGKSLEASSFRRKILALDLLEQSEGKGSGKGRPGKMWKLKDDMKTFDKRSLLPAGF
jgi:ADP-ribose pyrophosphatase YjhB (NUDIX family)